MSKCSHYQICISDALRQAEILCQKRGVRLTPLRRRVLKAIWQNHEAVKAYELIHQLSSENHTLKPPTVYRSLEFLINQGLIHRIESLNAYIGCVRPAEQHEPQLLICDTCGSVQEMSVPEARRALDKAASKAGFEVKNRTIEIHGTCQNCTKNKKAQKVDCNEHSECYLVQHESRCRLEETGE